MKQRKRFYGVEDRKNSKGLWIKQYLVTTDDTYNYYITRASLLWYNMQQRCKNEYEGVNCSFENYQIFTDWCQEQYGYMKKDQNGKFWHLDKDLLFYRNRDYSPEKCLFIPEYINALLLDRKKTQVREYPIGCHWNKINNNFNSFITIKAKHRYLGAYSSEIEAHRAWQQAKIQTVLEAAGDPEVNDRISSALISRAAMIQKDFDNGRETEYLC